MNKTTYAVFTLLSAVLISLLLSFKPSGDEPAPWSANELISPKDLAAILKGKDAKPLIFNIGPMKNIKMAIHVGSAGTADGRAKFKAEVSKFPKTQDVVIYCGCCATATCPNLKPAYKILKEEGFENIRLMDIKVSLTEEWEKKGYPMN
ncbi:MAG: rhodanese-like domain-containing protein [Bacteroidetes bacterium]|nr:rhodanese-like domain-containing protein [Bacteroidota bacterium]